MDPRPITGVWDDGWTLDIHVVRSIFIGYDERGHEQYDTTRTELGQLVYDLKYRGAMPNAARIAEITSSGVPIWWPTVTSIVPVPPTRLRAVQPVQLIADELGRLLRKPVIQAVVRSTQVPEIKGVSVTERVALLSNAHSARVDMSGQEVLLLDDLYQSGATLSAVTKVLRDAGAAKVFALAITRTRG